MDTILQLFDKLRLSRWSFARYLELSPPEYALASPAYPGGTHAARGTTPVPHGASLRPAGRAGATATAAPPAAGEPVPA